MRAPATPEIDFVGQVVDAIGAPVHRVAHSWRAHLALSATRARRITPLSLLCFEANLIYAHRPEGLFPWWPLLEDMVDRFGAAIAAGGPDPVAIIIDFFSRPGTFAAMPATVSAFCRATAATNLLDWRAAEAFSSLFAEFTCFDQPVTLVRGAETPGVMVDLTDNLASHIPGARTDVV